MNTEQRKIVKVSSGLIMRDDFNNSFSPLWDFFPNNMNRVLFAKDSIVLLAENNEPMEMLIPTPNDGDFVMQTEIEYRPSKEGEVAGCLIKSITGNIVKSEFNYEENEQEQYRYIKLSSNKSYIVNLRASKDGIKWYDLGNTKFYDGNHIGYFINGEESAINIRNCLMTKSSYITIHGISEGDRVYLNNDAGTDLIRKYNLDTKLSGDRFIIDLGPMMLPLEKIALTVTSQSAETTYIMLDEIYGGDVFKINPDIEMSVENTQSDDIYNLGEIIGEEQVFTLVLKNNSQKIKTGTIKIEELSSYEKGHEMAYLAPLDNYNLSLKKLEGVTLVPGETFKCLLKVRKESKYITIEDDYRFSVVFI